MKIKKRDQLLIKSCTILSNLYNHAYELIELLIYLKWGNENQKKRSTFNLVLSDIGYDFWLNKYIADDWWTKRPWNLPV